MSSEPALTDGERLDRIGAMYDLPRGAGEVDFDYSFRLAGEILVPSRARRMEMARSAALETAGTTASNIGALLNNSSNSAAETAQANIIMGDVRGMETPND